MPSTGKMRFYLIDLLRGTKILQQLSYLQHQQYLSSEELIAIGNDRLNNIAVKARSSVTYYKQFAQTNAFPELTKDIIREQMNDFLASDYKGKLLKKATGGSTGVPLTYYTTPHAQSFMWAGIIHAWKLVGYEFGDKVAFITGTALAKKDWQHSLFYKLMNIHIVSAYHLNSEVIKKYLQKLIDSKTKIIYGYPTALHEIALYLLEHNDYRFPDLKGIVVTSEVLEDKHRVNIEAAFNVVVRNQYGCNEGGISAFECEYGKLHLINTAAAIRIDQNGLLFSTNLINEGFLFINYNTGDTIKKSEQKGCSCKRGYPIIDKVIGRSVDLIVDKTGKKIHASFFSILFRADSTVSQFQVQFDESSIQIFLNVDPRLFSNQKENHYLKVIKNAMLFDRYIISLNQPFLNSANAKHKYVIDKRTKNIQHENLV